MTFETCLVFMLYVEYGFTNNACLDMDALYIWIKHSYLSMPIFIRVLNTWNVLI